MTSKWLLGSAAAAAILSALVACAPAAEVTEASGERVTSSTFDKNDVVSDAALLDKDALTSTQIQAFLDKTPWNTKSVLADYTEGGQSAAEIITGVAQKYGVNPIALLVRVQMEQSLLYKATAPDSTIAIAFGCGCPHSSICSAKYEGFANQADCAAGTLSRSITAATTSAGTASGWKKGVVKMTADNVNVNPANAATAALYTYTPYVGEAGGGGKGVGGASLHKSVWDKVTTTLGYTPSTAAASTTASTTTSTPDAGTSTTDTSTDDDDTGSTTSTPDAGASPTTTTATTKSSSATDDASLLEGGNAPPTSNNVPIPQSSGSKKSSSSSSSSSSATTTSGSASDDGAPSTDGNDGATSTKSPVASSGCSSTGHGGGGSGLFAGISVAIVGLCSRRRRRRTA